MDFVGNNTWFAVLLIVHVAGAIMGIGPTFAYGVMGRSAQAAGPNGGVAIMELMAKIEKVVVSPVYYVTQPLSGLGMIYNRGLNVGFFEQEWLWISILIYIVIGILAYGINGPALHRMIALAKAGPPGPEFEQVSKKVQATGPMLFLLGVAIVILMIWKPGSGCGTLLRC